MQLLLCVKPDPNSDRDEPDIKRLKEQVERARRRAAGITNSAERERVLAAADDYQRRIDAATMVSVDQYRQELRWQMDRAVTYAATEIVINGGELCRTLGRGYRRDADAALTSCEPN